MAAKSDIFHEGTFLQGLCMEMCPMRELSLRKKQNRLHPFEKTVENSSPKNKLNEAMYIAVKEFTRPAAGKELNPKDIRPAPVLLKTINYLLTVIMKKPSALYYKCEFISDRIRSVRQDLTAQNLQNSEAIKILEKATRYYLIMAVRLSQEPLERYDPVLHNTQLRECLKKLLRLYYIQNTPCKNWTTFLACDMILNLCTGSYYLFHEYYKTEVHATKHNGMNLAFDMIKMHAIGNFVGIFRIANTLPFLESCAFFNSIERLRSQGLRVMNTAFSSKNLRFPLQLLMEIFCFDSIEATAEFCTCHNILTQDENVFFKRGQFMEPSQHKVYTCHKLIGSKTTQSDVDLMIDE